MDIAELHSAFAWDCDHCGTENFCRGTEGDVDESAISSLDDEQVDQRLSIHLETNEYTEIESEDDDGESEGLVDAPWLQQKIVLAPPSVKCQKCGTGYQTQIAE